MTDRFPRATFLHDVFTVPPSPVLVMPGQDDSCITMVIGPARAVQAELRRRHLQPLRVHMATESYEKWLEAMCLSSDAELLAEWSRLGTVHGIETVLDPELDVGTLLVHAFDPLHAFDPQLRRRLGRYTA